MMDLSVIVHDIIVVTVSLCISILLGVYITNFILSTFRSILEDNKNNGES